MTKKTVQKAREQWAKAPIEKQRELDRLMIKFEQEGVPNPSSDTDIHQMGNCYNIDDVIAFFRWLTTDGDKKDAG